MYLTCPRCSQTLQAAGAPGQVVACPHCQDHMTIPAGPPEQPQPPPAPSYHPAAHTAPPQTPPLGSGFECPFCHTRAWPNVRQEISTAGWVVFVVLLVMLPCLCWIGLLIKEDHRHCSRCGIRLG